MEKISESEYRFLRILWKVEPVESPRLVTLCQEELGWKKSTTYTVIKNLSGKGIVKSENTIVEALVSKEEVDRLESEAFLKKTYQGNVPAFLASFLKDRKLSKKEAEEIKRMIEAASE